MDFTTFNASNFTAFLTALLGALDGADLRQADDILEEDFSIEESLSSLLDRLPLHVHNDDAHHNGETVQQHIREVIEAADALTVNLASERRLVIMLTALFHDLGKAYTHKMIDGRHTFHNHAKVSRHIAAVLLAPHRESLGNIVDRVLDMVRIHDLFLRLVNERKPGSLRYLRKTMQEPLYVDGHLEDLFIFSQADSSRSKCFSEKLCDAQSILDDFAKAEQQARDAEAEKLLQEAKVQEKLPEIRQMLEKAHAHEAAEALPNLHEVNRILGYANNYDMIRRIKHLCQI